MRALSDGRTHGHADRIETTLEPTHTWMSALVYVALEPTHTWMSALVYVALEPTHTWMSALVYVALYYIVYLM